MGSLDDKVLAEKHREAAATWPSFHVAPERFRQAIETSLEAGAKLESLHFADLYLALGCLARQAEAVIAFERHVLSAVRRAVERACGDPSTADDALQTALEKLLVGAPPAEPKLQQYGGRGALVAWVRVVAVREALQSKRKSRRERTADDLSMLAGGPSAQSVELAMLRDLHGAAFRAAVQQALGMLTPEQRTILRFHTKDGLSIDQLAPMLGVHRATAARRLERARDDALAHTRHVLHEHHGLSESEARSLCLALANEVDISIGRALEAAT